MYRFAVLLGLALAAPAAQAEDPLPANSFADSYGRYAPAGDCAREPRITVAVSGLEISIGGTSERIARPEVAWSYFGPGYQGIARALFPYTGAERPVIILLNDGEVPGALRIDPHDRGYQGGPPLSARHQALVDGSPYGRCGY
ncbi:hypothetical protein FKV24_003765 [Lysobacter maris]|uniref:Uncharacterized protein n=1 Tax=Marilutibacter maris TaxID=1605891 RepID=A0A508B771_9GAMM|nr:hypothetical protein [Lysobacter maris]KAB8198102.1 hypothetical protein FKV24_003765 [Lysobacter maris]